MEQQKTCSKCKIIKNLNEFTKRNDSRLGYKSHCKNCITKYSKKQTLEYARAYRKSNKDRISVQKKKYHNKNHDKLKKQRNLYYKSNKDTINSRAYYLKRYNLSIEDYNNLFQLQNNRCYICNKCKLETDRRFAVDHNHKTGKIRGILCRSCNVGLGCFSDSIEFLEKATQYLKKYNEDKL